MKKYAIMLGLLSLAASLSAIDNTIANVSEEDCVWDESHQGQDRIFKELYALHNGFSFTVPPTAGPQEVRDAYIDAFCAKLRRGIKNNPELGDDEVEEGIAYHRQELNDRLRIIRVSNPENKECHDPFYPICQWHDGTDMPSFRTVDGGSCMSGHFAKVTAIYGEW